MVGATSSKATFWYILLLGQKVIEHSLKPSVGLCVCLSVCPVHCGKTDDRIWMRFGMIGRMGPGMRQVVGFGDRSTGGGNFGGDCGAPHCNQ